MAGKKKKKNKYKPIYIMIAIFLISFIATVCIGKIVSKDTSNENVLPAFSSQTSSDSGVLSASSDSDKNSDNSSITTDNSNNASSDSKSSDTVVSITTAPESEQPQELTEMLSQSGRTYSDISASQLVIANTQSVYAKIYCYEKQENGVWVEKYSYSDGFIGYWGLSSNAAQNDKFTQSGLFKLGIAFGFDESMETGLDYTQIDQNSYWVTDKNSSYYNTLINDSLVSDFNSAVSMYEESYACGVEIKDMGNLAGVFLCCGDECTDRDIALSKEHLSEMISWLDKKFAPQLLVY